jgi:hypothetical protein
MGLVSGAAATIASLVLIVAGVMKVRDASSFASQIAAYQIVPRTVATGMGRTLPFLEIAAGLLLLLRPRLGGPLCSLLFLSFAVAVQINLLRGRTELVCGCFGASGRQPIRPSHVAMNLMLIAASLVAAISKGPPSLISARIGISFLALVLLLRAWRALHRIDREGERDDTRQGVEV